MFTTAGGDFIREFNGLKSESFRAPPTMRMAMLVSPSALRLSAESAEDNHYMQMGEPIDIERATRQHLAVGRKINELGIPVLTFPGVAGLDDGVFPNNTFATTRSAAVVGRMFHPVRQQESQRQDIRDYFKSLGHKSFVDLSTPEHSCCELTGSFVLDRTLDISLAGMSHRCTLAGAREVHEALDQRLTFAFPLKEDEYHTNIMLANLAGKAVLACPDAFENPEDWRAIEAAYGDAFIPVSTAEKEAYVCNCLAITPEDVLFSQTAIDGMSGQTRAALEACGLRLHGVKVSEIEKAGGSLRCLIAEIF